MTPNDLKITEQLDALVFQKDVLPEIESLATRLSDQLQASPDGAFVRAELPLALFGKSLPADIQSGNVYVIRPSVSSGLERHPNSHQRSMAFAGEGVFQLGIGSPASHTINIHSSSSAAERWVSIPPNTWHQAIASIDYWTVVTFHTASAPDIINERK